MFFHYHYRHHHYIQWWESAGDKSPPLSLLSKPHHGGFLTGGNMPVSHDNLEDYDDHDAREYEVTPSNPLLPQSMLASG